MAQSTRPHANRTRIDGHALSLAARVAAGLLGVALLIRHWNGDAGAPSGNLYVNAALLMCLGLVLLSDPLLDDAVLRGTAKLCGYAGLLGIALATLL
ncbi:MAG TPA: hypothetical protein VIY27_13950 [Myxococcota bacterium]